MLPSPLYSILREFCVSRRGIKEEELAKIEILIPHDPFKSPRISFQSQTSTIYWKWIRLSSDGWGFGRSMSSSTSYGTSRSANASEEAELKRYGYILGMKLDEGAYSKVREGYDPDKRKVAIKVINKKRCDKEFRLKFLPRELQIFSSLQHPNIVEIYDIIHIRHNVYIVMEYAGKDNLHNYLNLRGKLPEPRAKNMMASIISAIDYLHKKNIAHRDLKCGNILINSRNQLKLTDFGFARIIKPDELSETYCGSIAYSAPEVLRKTPYNPVMQDIWGIGVIAYQMVCGKLPFDELNIKKMVRTQQKRLFDLPPHMSVTCKEMITSILEPEVEKRLKLNEIMNHTWFSSACFVRDGNSLTVADNFEYSYGQSTSPECTRRERIRRKDEGSTDPAAFKIEESKSDVEIQPSKS